ncbi:MAG: DUF167 domain-containing protein [Pyrinomonadaceae bacterium]
MISFEQHSDAIAFNVKVIPRSSASGIVGEYMDSLKVKLNSPPVEGAANKELIKVLSKEFKVPKSAVVIIVGDASKNKRVKIFGVPFKLKAILEQLG